MSTRNGLIKALAENCAAECVYQGTNSDGSLSVDTNGVLLIAEDLRPTMANIKALRDILEGCVNGKMCWDDRILFDKTFEDSISTWLKVIPRRAP